MSSPGPGTNQISLPVLLHFSLSLVSPNPFHGAGFHTILETTFDLGFVTEREYKGQNSR